MNNRSNHVKTFNEFVAENYELNLNAAPEHMADVVEGNGETIEGADRESDEP